MLIAYEGSTEMLDLNTFKGESLSHKMFQQNRTHLEVAPRVHAVAALVKPDPKEPFILRRGDMLYGGWLWSAYPFGRVTLDGKTKEMFPLLRAKYQKYFNPNEALQIIGNQVLIADQSGMWLAKLKE
jgi:hypothetical protein